MGKKHKKFKAALEQYDREEAYDVEETVETVRKIAFAKFDETVEIHIRLGIDPRKSDQTVRGTTVLPHGTGKTPKVIVFTKGDKIKAAEEAGADLAGSDDLIQKVKDGFSDFDIAVASPDMMTANASSASCAVSAVPSATLARKGLSASLMPPPWCRSCR